MAPKIFSVKNTGVKRRMKKNVYEIIPLPQDNLHQLPQISMRKLGGRCWVIQGGKIQPNCFVYVMTGAGGG